jgi:hypothetical protein
MTEPILLTTGAALLVSYPGLTTGFVPRSTYPRIRPGHLVSDWGQPDRRFCAWVKIGRFLGL